MCKTLFGDEGELTVEELFKFFGEKITCQIIWQLTDALCSAIICEIVAKIENKMADLSPIFIL